ncbi:hypothetical protein BV898_09284 [Hypsibius exemplaris]|uniref:Uncharacterized protein n=1 Tax=Hypsibius exemplaris TaxID=2072580 RepID=A0A1W0WN23_HYPEX|nr:hypothetical protein BV898_09284 [Hypsibius exemplaris]
MWPLRISIAILQRDGVSTARLRCLKTSMFPDFLRAKMWPLRISLAILQRDGVSTVRLRCLTTSIVSQADSRDKKNQKPKKEDVVKPDAGATDPKIKATERQAAGDDKKGKKKVLDMHMGDVGSSGNGKKGK